MYFPKYSFGVPLEFFFMYIYLFSAINQELVSKLVLYNMFENVMLVLDIQYIFHLAFNLNYNTMKKKDKKIGKKFKVAR